ncbi:MAG: UDP-N-acetylglucosamine 1-carboxyvinyltransferase [Bacilli bacterium]|nr:UDP-N-acetylglucosamine 1-carboxyvinyltransferase [Bacilli bacterium]
MKILKVIGNQKLTGSIRISGAKNSAVALIPATLLASGKTTLCNIPNISDIEVLDQTLKYLNVKTNRASETMTIDTTNLKNMDIPIELSSKLRASYYFMAVLLARFKYVKMSFPGGCQIGSRPIDQTLKAFKLLGATIKEEDSVFTIEAKELIGNVIHLDMPSVGATINAILVATLAKGKTIIKNAAREPEISDLANLLNKMGANIKGFGTSEIEIHGVESLNPTNHDIIPDRIEAGTYTIIGALLGSYLKIDNIIPEHIKSLTDKLESMGANIEIKNDYLIIDSSNELHGLDIETSYYPGFPTDLQQPFATLLTQANGISNVVENIYENRFMNVPYLNKMGANIQVIENKKVIIEGPTKLIGCEVKATDLRAGASLLIASLIADGETIITDINHLLRGYEEIVEKLTNVGAKIEIKEI